MPANIAEHYEKYAQAFDNARRKNFVERPWIDRFMLPLSKGGHVLDLGCGAGEPIARYLMDSSFGVTGVDVSARMITLARTRFPRGRWLNMDMRKAMMDRTFTGVVAWDSLFHLDHDDQKAMLRKVAGWMEPGGAFLFNTGPAKGEAIGCQFGDDLYHASLDPGDYRAIFEEQGLMEVAFNPEDAHTGGRSIWLVRKLKN